MNASASALAAFANTAEFPSGPRSTCIRSITSSRAGTVAGPPPPNLALACACCNQFKGTDISAFDPLNGELVRLYPPRQQDWSAHFRFASIRIQGLSSSGRATTRHLRFNDAPRIEERRRLAKLGSLGARPPSAGI